MWVIRNCFKLYNVTKIEAYTIYKSIIFNVKFYNNIMHNNVILRALEMLKFI